MHRNLCLQAKHQSKMEGYHPTQENLIDYTLRYFRHEITFKQISQFFGIAHTCRLKGFMN